MYSQLLNHVLLPPTLRLARSSFLRIARQSHQRQFWARDRLRAWQFERLKQLVSTAVENVPFYRESYRNQIVGASGTPWLGAFEDFGELPIVSKKDVEASFPDRICNVNADRGGWRWRGSGGTTHRIMVIDDYYKREWSRAASFVTYTSDCRYRLGDRAVFIPPDACNSLCAKKGHRETSVLRHLLNMTCRGQLRDSEARSDLRGLIMNNWIERRTILDPFGPDGVNIPDRRLASYLDRLRRSKPMLLKALPEYLHALARYIERTGDCPPRIPVIRPMGSLMTPTVKSEVERAFCSQVREDYGSSDLGPMAFDCQERDGLHLQSDHYYFEFIRDGRPAEDGEPATLLVTDLHNRAMPLIRYQIGDVVTVDRRPCPCGRQTPRITVHGRIEDTIVTSRGGVVTPRMITELFYNSSQVDQFQLVEYSSGRFQLQCVVRNGGPDAAEFARRFGELTGDDRPFQLRKARTILPESSGKYRHVKSCSYENLQ